MLGLLTKAVFEARLTNKLVILFCSAAVPCAGDKAQHPVRVARNIKVEVAQSGSLLPPTRNDRWGRNEEIVSAKCWAT